MKESLNQHALARIASGLATLDDGFPQQRFIAQGLQGIEGLELKQRIDFIIELLGDYLPADYPAAAAILAEIPKVWDHGDEADPLSSFAAWPLIDYSARYGLDYPEIALPLLAKLTSLFSSEFAIRPFIKRYPDLCFDHFHQWLSSKDEHVRRLVSEGCRPRLPWGMRLPQFIKDPLPVFALLEKLKDDPSEYVRRSVANNLNDISKDNPQQVIERCQQWSHGVNKQRQWVIRHSLRSLVKAGDPAVFPLLGYSAEPNVILQAFDLAQPQLLMGENQSIQAILCSGATASQRLVVDYAIHHMKANGKQAAKVFKWRNIELAAGEQLTLQKKHPFKPVTTRRYYAGDHRVVILINGVPYGEKSFQLIL